MTLDKLPSFHFPHNIKHVVALVKNLPANAGDKTDAGLIPGSGRSPGGGNGNPLQYSGLGSPTDREAWSTALLGYSP